MVGAITMILFLIQKYAPKLVDAPVTDPKDNLSVFQLVHIAYANDMAVDQAVRETLENGAIWHEDITDVKSRMGSKSDFTHIGADDLEMAKQGGKIGAGGAHLAPLPNTPAE
jgi:hypothetical protein